MFSRFPRHHGASPLHEVALPRMLVLVAALVAVLFLGVCLIVRGLM